MSTEVWTAIIGGAISIINPIIAWSLAKKKYHTETDRNIIENMENALEFYKKLSDDNKDRLDEMTRRNDTLEQEIRELKNQVLNLSMNICMNLACETRSRKYQIINTRQDGKSKDRLDETKTTSRR